MVARGLARTGAALLLLAALLPHGAGAQEADRAGDQEGATSQEVYRIGAVRTDDGPTIDGVLDEPVWNAAVVIEDFTQQEPLEGAPASERTVVRVLYDESNLYLGIQAFDSQPEGVVATEMRRDADRILQEDNFQIILDTFMDSRSAYMFVLTPLGAKLDQQVFDEGGRDRRATSSAINRDWDGVWEASARRTNEGWVAEVAIPMVTLRFPEADPQSWGVNFMRNISRKNEQVYWAPIPRAFELTRVSLAGSMSGLSELSRGMDLRVKPYVTGGARSQSLDGVSDRSTQSEFGVDAKYGLTASLNLDLTVNTDFAQAEVDDERVNLTRFALFFPEKRDFFLENSAQFAVGTTTSTGRIADLFFSRRIGLSSSGANIPILAGARVTGRIGASSIAVMDIQTDDFTPEGSDQTLPGENFLVARYALDVFENSQIGGLVVNKQASSGGGYNRTYALDAMLPLTPSLTVNGFLSRTDSPDEWDGVVDGEQSVGWGSHIRAGWLDQDWRIYAEHTDLGDHFNPEVGFVPRVGIRRSKFHFERNPRPGRWGIRVMEPMANVTYFTDQTGRLVSRQFHYMVGTRFQSGAYLNVWYNRYFERLDEPFRVASGVSVDPGKYNFGDWQVSFRSNPSDRFTYNASWSPQTFWDGNRTDYSVGAGLRVTDQLATNLSFSRNEVDLPAGEFDVNLGSLQLDYALSPAMSLRTLTQYNSQTEQWSTSARFRYIYRPGSDLYIVYDEVRRDIRDQGTGPNPLPTQDFRDRRLIVKATYLLSF